MAAAAAVEHQVKVDFTALPFVRQTYLAFINFTIPVENCRDRAILSNCTNLIEEFLRREIQSSPVLSIGFQVTASFILKNSQTNQTRKFTGSFFNAASVSNSLTGEDFFPYRSETFHGQIQRYANPTEAARILNQTTQNLDTDWEVESILSVIVNVQSVLPTVHRFLRDNQLDFLVDQNGRRRKRRHITTYLPRRN